MVWSMVKCVYGFKVELPPEAFKDGEPEVHIQEDYDLTDRVPLPKFKYLPFDGTFAPQRFLDLKLNDHNAPEGTVFRQIKFNGNGQRAVKTVEKLGCTVSSWKYEPVVFDYSIPEFTPHQDKDGYYHYCFFHPYPCCSEESDRTVIVGLVYADFDRNAYYFSGNTTLSTGKNIFNNVCTVDMMTDETLRDQCREVDPTIRAFVDSFSDKFPGIKPYKYLMLDDCTFCT